MREVKQCCGSCHFASFERSKSGRVLRGQAGDCTYTPQLPPLPDSITKAYGFNPELSKQGIWPDDGTHCPVYETLTPA